MNPLFVVIVQLLALTAVVQCFPTVYFHNPVLNPIQQVAPLSTIQHPGLLSDPRFPIVLHPQGYVAGSANVVPLVNQASAPIVVPLDQAGVSNTVPLVHQPISPNTVPLVHQSIAPNTLPLVQQSIAPNTVQLVQQPISPNTVPLVQQPLSPNLVPVIIPNAVTAADQAILVKVKDAEDDGSWHAEKYDKEDDSSSKGEEVKQDDPSRSVEKPEAQDDGSWQPGKFGDDGIWKDEASVDSKQAEPKPEENTVEKKDGVEAKEDGSWKAEKSNDGEDDGSWKPDKYEAEEKVEDDGSYKSEGESSWKEEDTNEHSDDGSYKEDNKVETSDDGSWKPEVAREGKAATEESKPVENKAVQGETSPGTGEEKPVVVKLSPEMEEVQLAPVVYQVGVQTPQAAPEKATST